MREIRIEKWRTHSMDEYIKKIFNDGLEFKLNGGVGTGVFVSDSIWLGGLWEGQPHKPFVAIGPKEWDGEEELTFFKSEKEVNDFIEKLQEASKKAFNDEEAK